MFRSWPDERLQRRADELVAALDERNAACAAVRARYGMDEIHERWDAVSDRLGALVERIEAIQPKTLQGLQAKSKVILNWHWENLDPDDVESQVLEVLRGLASTDLAA